MLRIFHKEWSDKRIQEMITLFMDDRPVFEANLKSGVIHVEEMKRVTRQRFRIELFNLGYLIPPVDRFGNKLSIHEHFAPNEKMMVNSWNDWNALQKAASFPLDEFCKKMYLEMQKGETCMFTVARKAIDHLQEQYLYSARDVRP